ncbi:c-type cytochrome [Sorangium sp. So ce131]|uniref:c-type cytochrome n=1 Tax=Sorangium sp. So ce131 TaxID=3133282 RepID=UPI003F637C6D
MIGALQGCGGGDGDGGNGSDPHDLGECPADSAAQQAAGAQALETHCQVCHTTALTGTVRGTIPAEINVDDPESIRSEGGEMYESIVEGTMPQGGGKLPDATIEDIRVYLACEAQ